MRFKLILTFFLILLSGVSVWIIKSQHQKLTYYEDLLDDAVLTSLPLVKTDTVFVTDTIVLKADTVRIVEALVSEVVVTDTVLLSMKELKDRVYIDTLVADNLQIRYEALVRGWLLELELRLDPGALVESVYTEHLIPVPYTPPYRGFNAGGGLVLPVGWYLSAGYRIRNLTYRCIYLNTYEKDMLMFGVEFNF